MINPVQTSLVQPDGAARKIIIEPVLVKDDAEDLKSTGVFKIYKDAFGDETVLFTEPLEFKSGKSDLADENNPDYLGKFTVTGSSGWEYEGDLLSAEEQQQLAGYILSGPYF